MAIYRYDRRYWENRIQAHSLEWVMTSGNGAYSGGTIAGGRNRTHQGYLVAALEPPTKRYVVLEEITEYVRLGDTDYDLESVIRKNGENADGHRFLKKVSYDGTVRFEYELRPQAPGSAPDCESGTCAMSVVKHMAMVRGENTLAVDYTLTNYSADKAEVYITPKFNLREHNTLSSAEDMIFETILTGDTLSIVKAQPGNEVPGSSEKEVPGDYAGDGEGYSANEGPGCPARRGAGSPETVRIDFSVSEGEYLELSEKYDTGKVLPIEVALETEGVCDFYMPYEIRIEVAPGGSKHVSAVCSVVCADVPDKRPDASPSDAEAGSPGAEPDPRQLLESATDRFVGANTAKKLISQVREYYDGIEKTAVENLRRLTDGRIGSQSEDMDTPKNHFPESADRSDENSAGSDRNMEFFKRLVLDADHFIADRRSTGLKTVLAGLPWFADWGRDTMIAFTGLTLCTGRYEDAREILKSFAMYERNGLIPNMFPDSGEEPLYNTADASLWYFVAVWNYIRYLGNSGSISRTEYEESVGEIGPQSNKHAMMKDRGRECEIRPEQNGSEQNGPDSFIRDEIYPVLLRILDAYEHGTDNDIHMEPSGLIHAGSGIDQVTWMDVRVDGVCVTPRHGCPVEINALWYNALKIGGELAERFGDEDKAKHCLQLADRVEAVFESIYYNKETGFLYDVVDGYQADEGADRSSGDIDNAHNGLNCLSGTDQPAEGLSPEGIGFRYTIMDDSLRPNQLYAASLPFSPVNRETAWKIVDTVEKELYVGCGIRSLAPSHRDYHGQYRGALAKRDQSYHQGTAWGFLLGAFITAYMKAYHGSSTEDSKTDYSIESMDAPADTDPIDKQTDPLERFFAPVRLHQSEANCIGGICEVFEGDAPHAGCGCYTQAWSTGEILRAYVETMR